MNREPDLDQPETDIIEKGRQLASRATSSARAGGRRAKELARHRAKEVREQAERYADVAEHQLQVAQRRVSGTLREKPITTLLAVAGAALLLSALFAARAPTALTRAADRVRREL